MSGRACFLGRAAGMLLLVLQQHRFSKRALRDAGPEPEPPKKQEGPCVHKSCRILRTAKGYVWR